MISQLFKIEQQIELKFVMNLRLKKSNFPINKHVVKLSNLKNVFWYILEVQF